MDAYDDLMINIQIENWDVTSNFEATLPLLVKVWVL